MRAISGLFGSRPSIGFPNWQECSETPDSFGLVFSFFFNSNEMPLCGEWRMLPLGQNISGIISTCTQPQKKKKAPTATSAALRLNALHFNMWFIWGCFKSLSLSQRNRCTREAIPSVRDVRSRSDRDACGAGFESLSQKIKSTAAVFFVKRETIFTALITLPLYLIFLNRATKLCFYKSNACSSALIVKDVRSKCCLNTTRDPAALQKWLQ